MEPFGTFLVNDFCKNTRNWFYMILKTRSLLQMSYSVLGERVNIYCTMHTASGNCHCSIKVLTKLTKRMLSLSVFFYEKCAVSTKCNDMINHSLFSSV